MRTEEETRSSVANIRETTLRRLKHETRKTDKNVVMRT